MSWLTTSMDEVSCFHVEFEQAANEALGVLGLQHEYQWVHHLRTPGNTLIPDFVLQRRTTRQWVLAFEIKRTLEAVYSTRNQIQAQGYATTNQNLYSTLSPKYFVISNLEETLLFALNGNRPPRECVVENGKFSSGRFVNNDRDTHRQQFISDLVDIINYVTQVMNPNFDQVWPTILSELVAYADSLPTLQGLTIPEPTTSNWLLVKQFFAQELSDGSALLFFVRCLMVEYLRGTLIKFGHPRATQIPALQENDVPGSIARAIASIQQIDFRTLFEEFAPNLYRSVRNPQLQQILRQYVTSLNVATRRVVDLAITRVDAQELLESLMTTICPIEDQGDKGKVQTDPELARVLAYLTIPGRVQTVLDPCAGDGSLISAAYDRLIDLRLNQNEALSSIAGLEADPVAVRLASLRLALKQPASLSPDLPFNINQGDMFSNCALLNEADVILMNPPFKRYEEQDRSPVPVGLRDHYNERICAIDGREATTTVGQPNLYNYYVEFVLKSAKEGARIGLILDNKWFHSKYGQKLRELLLSGFTIEGIIDYPHNAFFSNWAIATSILVLKKSRAEQEHLTKFVRSKVDPRGVNLPDLASAFFGNNPWPVDWTVQTVLQRNMNAQSGWKSLFSTQLNNNFLSLAWPTLNAIFSGGRRGSLAKEGGATSLFEFPFNRNDYGARRVAVTPRRRFQTREDRELTSAENEIIINAAEQIPLSFRGFALKNADDASGFILCENDVTINPTLEPPLLRDHYVTFLSDRRTPWDDIHDHAIDEMEADPLVRPYLESIENIVNLTDAVLPKRERFVVLQEPVAGEIIIPRKTRSGHRVHINPFAFNLDNRQVRISSNFVTYQGCIEDVDNGLDRETATKLISAFLLSSFGQLQFEIQGYNREGMLALEKAQLDRIKIFDPRWVRSDSREPIINAFQNLPYPIPTNRLSFEQLERNALDILFANEIVARHPEINRDSLLQEVHDALDEWLEARKP